MTRKWRSTVFTTGERHGVTGFLAVTQSICHVGWTYTLTQIPAGLTDKQVEIIGTHPDTYQSRTYLLHENGTASGERPSPAVWGVVRGLAIGLVAVCHEAKMLTSPTLTTSWHVLYLEARSFCFVFYRPISDGLRTTLQPPPPRCDAFHPYERHLHDSEQIPQAEDRYDLYLENKSWEKAAEVAARLKDPRYAIFDCMHGNQK